MIESANPLKCGNDPSGYWQLLSTGKVAVTTGTWGKIDVESDEYKAHSVAEI